VVFLLLKCGQEIDFVNAYSSAIITKSINIISVQDSVSCLSTANYFSLAINNSTLNVFKMIPVDVSLIDYQSNINSLLSLITKNVTTITNEVRKSKEEKSVFLLRICFIILFISTFRFLTCLTS
jgi:hypothetical protein